MKDRIIVFISTRKDKTEARWMIKNVDITIGCEHQILICSNPGTHSLTNLYGSFLERESEESKERTIYVFCHDDIEYVTINWGKKLLDIFNNNPEYGIVGLAGTKYYDGTKPWWNYDDEYKVGKVIHRTNKQGEGHRMWITPMSLVDDNGIDEVVTIDGLFIAIDATKISQNFDKEIKGFHFYDIDFCLNNFRDGKCKIGVTTNIRVIHDSVGAINKAWQFNQEAINEKYKDNYPFSLKKGNDEENKE